jgi:hypothetical protein
MNLKNITEALLYAVEHPACKPLLCINDGTPGGWRPAPDSTRLIAVHAHTVVLAQDAVHTAMQARLTYVALSAITWVSIVEPTANVKDR